MASTLGYAPTRWRRRSPVPRLGTTVDRRLACTDCGGVPGRSCQRLLEHRHRAGGVVSVLGELAHAPRRLRNRIVERAQVTFFGEWPRFDMDWKVLHDHVQVLRAALDDGN